MRMSEDLKEDMKPKAGSAGPDRAGRHGLPAGTNPRSRFSSALSIGRPCPQQGGYRQVSAIDHPAKTAGLRRSGTTACGPAPGGNARWRPRTGSRLRRVEPHERRRDFQAPARPRGSPRERLIASEPLERGEEARRRAMLAGAAIDRRSGASIDAKDRKGNRLRLAQQRRIAGERGRERRSGIARMCGNTGQRGAAGVC